MTDALRLGWAGIAVVLSTACQSTVFTIPAGSHASTSAVVFHRGTELAFDARFDDSAMYTTRDPANQLDINKLYGFSDCSAHHHTASARVGWRWVDERLEVLAYTYADGEVAWAALGDVSLEHPHRYRIEVADEVYRFTLDEGTSVVLPRGCRDAAPVMYRLWPYFGGDETAPHDITIEVTRR